MKIWAKTVRNNKIINDTVIEDSSDDTRTHKVFKAIDEVVNRFDLSKPIWLDANIKDFKNHSKVKFRQESFVEEIDFDYLEFQVLEED